MELTKDSEWFCNYFQLRCYSPFFAEYVYADLPDYLADAMFEKHRVHIMFGDELVHPEQGYRLILVRLPRWEQRRFIAAMSDLKDVMALEGHGDYRAFCGFMEGILGKAIK